MNYGPQEQQKILQSLLQAGQQQQRGKVPQSGTGAYGDLLRIIRELNRLTVAAQIPATLGAQVFIDDPEERRQLLKILDLVNIMTGAPLVGDKMSGGLRAIRQAPPEARAGQARTAVKDVGIEALLQAVPALREILS